MRTAGEKFVTKTNTKLLETVGNKKFNFQCKQKFA